MIVLHFVRNSTVTTVCTTLFKMMVSMAYIVKKLYVKI